MEFDRLARHCVGVRYRHPGPAFAPAPKSQSCSPLVRRLLLEPLVTKELFHPKHMDALLLPFVLAAVLTMAAGWHYRAAVLLALATSI